MALRRVQAAGLNARLVSSIHETGFENRENIHFHRFADDTYVFSWYRDLPDVQVYRVETFDETVAAYRQSLRDRPADADTLAGLGVALIATGQIHEAIAVFQQAVDIAPDEGRSQRNLANALLDAGEVEGAASHARLAVASAPDDPGAHDVLGRVLGMLGRLDEAARQFRSAIELDPQYSEARAFDAARRVQTTRSAMRQSAHGLHTEVSSHPRTE